MTPTVPELTEQWFAEHGRVDGAQAVRAWRHWLAQDAGRTEAAKYRKALEIASGLSAGAIGHYLNQRTFKLGKATLDKLDAITIDLGYHPPERTAAEPASTPRQTKRIALLTELAGVPSPPYHLAVIGGITRAASAHGFATAVHEVSPRDLASAVKRIVRDFRPEGAIMIRITPDAEALKPLKRSSIPTVLVHADRLEYPSPPVLANVVPKQEAIPRSLRLWLDGIDPAPRAKPLRRGEAPARKGTDKLVLVTMPYEPVTDERAVSIRNERIRLAEQAMRAMPGYGVDHMTVDDYSFRRGVEVLAEHPDAPAYVCFSDQIAVAVKHLLEAAGKDTTHRIVGFDDSELARRANLSSFGQHLGDLGKEATGKLDAWYERNAGRKGRSSLEWPDFDEVPTDVHLVVRD